MRDSFLNPVLRSVPQTDWVVFVIFLVSILYISSRLLFPRYHTRMAHSFFSRYEAYKLIEEKNVTFRRTGFLLNIVSLSCIAMLVYMQVAYFTPETLSDRPVLHYLGILAAVIVYFGARILLVYLFGLSFDQKEKALRFNQVYLLQFEYLGTLILIPSLVIPFTAGFVKIGILIVLWVMVGLWVLYTVVRELQLLKTKSIPIFYMFLYLCTLEILPLWWTIQSITEGW